MMDHERERSRREHTAAAGRLERLRLPLLLVAWAALAGCTCETPPASPVDGGDGGDALLEIDAPAEDAHGDADGSADEQHADDDGFADDAGEETGPPRDIRCGNGIIDPGEECDDGNRLNGDACDWSCRNGPGEDPPELPPDPTVEPANPELPPTRLDLDAENPAYYTRAGPGNRIPLVSDGRDYATVWPHRASAASDSAITGTFVRFDTAGRRRDAPWRYNLTAADLATVHIPLVDLAWSGSGYGLLWSGRAVIRPGEGPGISFLPLDIEGKPLTEPISLSRNGEYQYRLGLAWDGVGYGCLGEMFEDADPPVYSLGLMRVTAMGDRRDPRRHLLDGSPEGHGEGSLAASGELYVAVWAGYPGSGSAAQYGVAGPDGIWYGAATLGPIGPPMAGVPPDVVWSGSEFGIAWFGPGRSPEVPALWFARLSARGELVAPPRRAGPDDLWGGEVAVTFGHRTFAVGFFGIDSAELVRLDGNGTLVDHASSEFTGDSPLEPVGIAADDFGFGIIGATWPLSSGESWGPPMFTWFRVVAP
jgi:cysteine-rich repeat protein